MSTAPQILRVSPTKVAALEMLAIQLFRRVVSSTLTILSLYTTWALRFSFPLVQKLNTS